MNCNSAEDEKVATEDFENPAFNISNTDISAHQTYKVGLITPAKLTSSLAAHPQKFRLQAQAEPRGNECSRNYFDPLMDEEINPRQCGIEVSKEALVKSDEIFLYDEQRRLIDKGGKMVVSHEMKVEEIQDEDNLDSTCPVSSIKISDLHDEVKDEDILPYIEQFEKEVHNEVILLGNFPFKQALKYENIFRDEKYSRRLPKLFQSKPESQVLETASNAWKMRAAAKLRNLAGVSHNSNGTAVPCWKVNCTKKSQFTDIHLKCLRGIKDKVPQGSYSLKVSICKQLDGKFLSCFKVDGQQLAGKSLPVRHNGNFYDVEISFGQSIYTDVPVKKNGKPGEILLFELFLLQGTSDRLVGWGAFPLCNNNLDIVDGKFKCPLLRGHYDSRIDRFQKIEKLISSDLDHWLGNLYFQIIKLPWCSDEQYKYEVGLQPSSKILQYSGTAEKDGISKEIIGQPLTPRRDSETRKGSIPTVEKEVRRRFNAVRGGKWCTLEQTKRKITNSLMDNFQQVKKNDPNDMVVQSSSKIRLDTDDGVLRSYQEELEKHRFSVCCHPAIDAKVSARFTKHFYFGVYDAFFELGRGQWYSWDFWSSVLLIILLWFIRLYLHYFSQWILLHVFAVPVTKFQFYLYTVDLCYQNSLVHASEEMAMVVVGPLTLNTGMLLLILMRWGCQLLFDSFPIYLSKLIMAWGFWTVLDPLAVFVVDAFLGRLYYTADNPTADCAKLYWLFLRTEQTGIPGALITALLYAVLFLFSSATLHLYWLRLYNESWLLDLLQRIQGDETSFFVPCDLEISIQELSYLVKKAEQWRGIGGERRKVVVYEYFWEDQAEQTQISCSVVHPQGEILKCVGNSRGITIHVMIYTVHLGGFQELYRHFLRLPSGAIVEGRETSGNPERCERVKQILEPKLSNYPGPWIPAFGDVNGISFACNEVTADFEEQRSGMDPLLEASSSGK